MAATVPALASEVVVRPASGLRGELRLPGDKSISHRALILALLARGTSRITGAGDGADVRSTAAIAQALGATVRRTAADGGNVDYAVTSPGSGALDEPAVTLDCGNSGTSMRLFAGILAGQPLRTILDGDASLRRRPMARIVEPLKAMGAWLEGMAGDRPPLIVVGQERLKAIEWTTPVPSAQVKSAILLAGLSGSGTTTVRESVATRDHTERMLRARGVTVSSETDGSGGARVRVEGGQALAALDERVPGDPSAAAFWLVAAAVHPDADLTLRAVGVNPTRRAVIDILGRMGASIEETPVGEAAGDAGHAAGDAASAGDATVGVGEPVADLRVTSARLSGVELAPAETAAAIDEIPILCLAATQASGRTVIRGTGELRHKESDRIAGIVAGLSALGARIAAAGDDITIEGPTTLRGAVVDSLNDHRLALTFAIAGLVAGGATTVLGADSVAISYPTFFADLERIRS
jgi:3-phosphoshikimate 1-carboxyvinyltransferase